MPGAQRHFNRELAAEAGGHLYARECCANVWYAIGAMRWRRGDREQAREAFAQALRRVQGHALASIGLAAAGLPACSQPRRAGLKTRGHAYDRGRRDRARGGAHARRTARRGGPPRGRRARRVAARQCGLGAPRRAAARGARARVGRGARALAQPRRLIARAEFSDFSARAVRTWRPGTPHHPVMEVRMRHAASWSCVCGVGRSRRRPRTSSSRRRSRRASTCPGRASA